VRRAIIVAGILIGAAVTFFTITRTKEDPFRYTMDVARELQARVTPPGGKVAHESAPLARIWSVRVRWHLDAGSSWSEYLEWVDLELSKDFTLVDRADGIVHYSRRERADRHLLELRLLREGPPLVVVVTLVTSPS
jgi:hypothetical protein